MFVCYFVPAADAHFRSKDLINHHSSSQEGNKIWHPIPNIENKNKPCFYYSSFFTELLFHALLSLISHKQIQMMKYDICAKRYMAVGLDS